jgi:hypothetical protein
MWGTKIVGSIIHGVFMSAQDQDEGTRTAFAVLIPLLVLVVGFVVGLGIHKAKGPKAKAAAPVAVVEAAPEAAPAAAATPAVEAPAAAAVEPKKPE